MNRNNKKMFIRAISFLSVACVVLTVSTVVYANRAQKYKFATQIVYERALAELCESLDNITVSLQKGTYCSTGRMLSEIGNDLNRQATSAKVSLSQLTDKTVPSDEMYKFLSQIGAFTLSVAQNKDRLSLSEKQKKVKEYVALPQMQQAIRTLKPENQSRNKQIVSTLVRMKQFFALRA